MMIFFVPFSYISRIQHSLTGKVSNFWFLNSRIYRSYGTTSRNVKDSMYVKTVTAELEFTDTPEAQQKGKDRMEEYLDLWS